MHFRFVFLVTIQIKSVFDGPRLKEIERISQRMYVRKQLPTTTSSYIFCTVYLFDLNLSSLVISPCSKIPSLFLCDMLSLIYWWCCDGTAACIATVESTGVIEVNCSISNQGICSQTKQSLTRHHRILLFQISFLFRDLKFEIRKWW